MPGAISTTPPPEESSSFLIHMSAHLKHIVESLELQTTGSSDEIWSLIKGKLNYIIATSDERPSISLELSLMDEGGVFHESTHTVKPVKVMGEDLRLRDDPRQTEHSKFG